MSTHNTAPTDTAVTPTATPQPSIPVIATTDANQEITIPLEPSNTVQANRVYNLSVELLQMKQNKKAAMRGFTDEIKRIESEIKDILKGDGNINGVEE